MKEYHTSIKINKPIQEVWNVLTDFEAYPDWNPLAGKLTGDVKENGTIENYIIPLKKSYKAKILSFKNEKELVWQSV